MESTTVVKEIDVIAQNKDIKMHQYLDDWLVTATPHQPCLQHSQTLVALCQVLAWLVNIEKSELEPKQIFDSVGCQYNLREDKVRPTLEQ